MIGRGLIIAALLVYVAVMGCVLLPTDDSHARTTADYETTEVAVHRTVKLTGLPYRGVAIQVMDINDIPGYLKMIDQVADVGFDTVLLVVEGRMENGNSTEIFVDQRMTPSAQQIEQIINHAKERKLRVMLMPIVLLQRPVGDQWRGNIEPTVWEYWFDSYRWFITHFANIAEESHADVFVVGSELVTTEDKKQEWDRTISAVRSVYHGQLTYSSNWDHYVSVTFWDRLDLIGMNSYWKLGENNKVTVDQIVANWHNKIQKDLLAFVRKEGKPLLFLEVGWCSLANAADEPWDYTKDTLDVDLDLQARLYQGFFTAWEGNPELGGYTIWKWSPGGGGPDDKGYSPEGKPAMKVLKEWLRKPAWEVK